jgi:hypothetical protein
VRRLFAASLGGGLDGATLRLRARRGAAPLADGILEPAPFEEV